MVSTYARNMELMFDNISSIQDRRGVKTCFLRIFLLIEQECKREGVPLARCYPCIIKVALHSITPADYI